MTDALANQLRWFVDPKTKIIREQGDSRRERAKAETGTPAAKPSEKTKTWPVKLPIEAQVTSSELRLDPS
jgi:hypothetical protein